MPEFTIDFSVYCATCGEGLCGNTNVNQKHNRNEITIDACPKCMKEKDDLIQDLEEKIEQLKEN